jgi:hypothetical protein
MRAAELITIAGTKGIDLKSIAGNASNTWGVARKRDRTREEIYLGIDVEPTAVGKESRVMRPAQWTSAEAGMAAFEVPRMPWLAARYSWARDTSNYRELHAGLTSVAFDLKEKDRWPWRVTKLNGSPGYYIEELGQLVLGFEMYKSEFLKYPVLYAACLGVSDEVWAATLSRCFASLHGKYERWLGIVQSLMGQWLRERIAEEDAAEATS